jgi:hypothetical protein
MNGEIIGDGWFMIGELRHDLVMWWCIAGFSVGWWLFGCRLVISFVIWRVGCKSNKLTTFFEAFVLNFCEFAINCERISSNHEK